MLWRLDFHVVASIKQVKLEKWFLGTTVLFDPPIARGPERNAGYRADEDHPFGCRGGQALMRWWEESGTGRGR
jgi:hypothetical protein